MYHDIAESIINAIMAGDYDTKLPTEKDLMTEYNASRNTIRKAIDVVFRHGLLRRVQGSGYYIIKQPLQSKKVLNLSIGFDRTAMVEGGPLTSQILTFDTVTADAKLAAQGNVEIGSELYRVIRLRYLKEVLYDLETSYFPRSVVPFLSEEAVDSSIFTFLRKEYHIVGSTTENYVHLAQLTAEQAAPMKLATGTATLCLDGINYLANGEVFNFSSTYFVYPELALYYHTENIDLEH